ncbi:MAG: cytochrome P450 [Polyangiaceae bacterium]
MFDYDLTKPLTWAECHEQDRAALAAGPVCRHYDGSPVFVRYDDVAHLLSHPDGHLGYGEQMVQGGVTAGLLHQVISGSFIVADEPTHTRLRGLVSRAFGVRPMERMRDVARKAAEQALERVSVGDPFDLFEDFAGHVPLRVMCSLLGIPGEYAPELRSFLRDVTPAILAPDSSEEVRAAAERALARLFSYADEIAREKLATPDDDIISLLATAERDGRMSRIELQSMITMLLFAGTDTSRSLLGLGMLTLAEHPDELAKLHADADLAVTAVEEVLRFACPSPWISRFAVNRIERAGLTLEPGTMFILSAATAGLDPNRFAQPHRFDIRRVESQHLTFGRGRHFCLGAALARVEGQEVFRALARRRLELALVGDEAPRFIRAGVMVEPAAPVTMRAT